MRLSKALTLSGRGGFSEGSGEEALVDVVGGLEMVLAGAKLNLGKLKKESAEEEDFAEYEGESEFELLLLDAGLLKER